MGGGIGATSGHGVTGALGLVALVAGFSAFAFYKRLQAGGQFREVSSPYRSMNVALQLVAGAIFVFAQSEPIRIGAFLVALILATLLFLRSQSRD